MSFYGTTANADSYHADRGNTSWADLTNDQQKQALLRGSEYIDSTFRTAFMGYRTIGREQDREWPREDAYVFERWQWTKIPNDQVPKEVEHATYEAALREGSEPGFLTPDVIPGQNKKMARVEGAVWVEYWSDDQKPVVEKIGMVLAPLIASDGYQSNPLSGKAAVR